MQISLKNRKALVCGASQGIGKATAELLAASGAQVTIVARNEEKLIQVLEGLPGEGHSYLTLDFQDTENLKSIIFKQKMNYDLLICNSGGPPAGPIVDADEQAFTKGLNAHVLANSILFKSVYNYMKEGGFGRVVNIISTSVKAPIANLGVSNTIRAAVASWAKTLSLEVGKDNITVNNVLPGYTETPRLEALINSAAQRQGKSQKEITQLWKTKVPLARFAKAEEVAAAVVFLCSEQAGYVNGINLPVDGGRTASL